MIRTIEDAALDGTRFWAEIMPATPLLIIPKPKGQAIKYWLKAGRSWREPHIRWWVEVMSDLDGGTHHINQDTGATTFRGALWQAQNAVDAAIEEHEQPNPLEEKK